MILFHLFLKNINNSFKCIGAKSKNVVKRLTPKAIKENSVSTSVKDDLNLMAKSSEKSQAKETTVKGDDKGDCSNYDLYLEMRKLRLDSKIIKNMLKDSLNVSSKNEMDAIKESFPFKLPLSSDELEICEDFLAKSDNKELLVSKDLGELLHFYYD